MNINNLTNKNITYETTKTKQLKIKETSRDVYVYDKFYRLEKRKSD